MHLPLRVRVLAIAAAVVSLSGHALRAQNLPFLLFERYLEPLRISAGIPGLSAVIVQDGSILWERGLGYRDLEANLDATPSTPYPLGNLTQAFTAALLLHCTERGELQLGDPISQWAPAFDPPTAPLRQLLSHTTTANGFRYDPSRFALLAHPVETCFDAPFRKVVAREVFDRFAMTSAVPGPDIGVVPPELRQLFDESAMARYASLLAQMAVPYRVDRRGRATRSEAPASGVDGANGLIASARDLAKFDGALTVHLRPDTLESAWTNVTHNGRATPAGLGWFVQTYNGERVVWHFGNVPDAYSSLMLKVPARHLTLILLANSDGLSAPFSLDEGDVTSSLFARTFLRLFL
jgi:CubicO group peptidase (beta-lactamase class C family)